MAAIASHQPSLNYFSHQQRNQVPLNLSPAARYAYAYDTPADLPHDFTNDFANDYSNDSAPSPGSPLSLVFTNPYQLPSTDDDWLNWDAKALTSPNSDVQPKLEPFDSPMLAANLPRYVSVSPAVNPLDLSAPGVSSMDDVEVSFGRGGIADTQPLFQSPSTARMPTPPTREEKLGRNSTSRSATAASGSRKRKSTGSDLSPRSSASPPPPPSTRRATIPSPSTAQPQQKKTTHNVIEKRYRTNLNDKIAALRDSVPSLRVMARRLEHGQSSDDADEEMEGGDEDLGGLAPAHKLNKATVLSKATEYISHLERKNKSLARENAALRDKVEGFEMLVMSRGRPGSSAWS